MTSLLALAGLLSTASSLARAQDDGAAGLFTEARQLPLVSQAISVEIAADEALVHLSQVFRNDGPRLAQADYSLHLPDGGSVESFGFWTGDRLLQAELQDRQQATAAHAAAAAEGRATGILHSEGSRQSFSVFPVEAGRPQQIELELRLPVEVEAGRRELRLPIDRFLGQSGVVSTVTVRLRSDRPLQEVGLSLADGTELPMKVLSADPRQRLLVATSAQESLLHWQEEAPPLDLVARSVPTPDGTALDLRFSMQEAPDAPTWDRVLLIVDQSHSMARRASSVEAAVARVQEGSRVPVTLRRVGGHWFTWTELAAETEGEDCGAGTRCVVITDAQVEGLAAAEGQPVELIVLADPHEKTHFADRIPPRAAVYQPGVEPLARLRGLVDNAVLPVLEIEGLRWGTAELRPLAEGPWRLAQGGLLRLRGFAEGQGELTVTGRLNGEPFERRVQVTPVPQVDGPRVRRAVYREQLAAWMRGWKSQPDEATKDRIVALSLREGIPTAFTSLQVDDPELSLVAIKPGDPTLHVDGAPGVSEVLAWYPFGDMRRLRRDGEGFSDRFLVPRAWAERAYRVDVFEHGADGEVRGKEAWYLLDEQAPEAVLRLEDGALRVDTGAGTPDIGAVDLQAPGRSLRLRLEEGLPLASASTWTLPSAELPEAFTVVVRDRAGNTTRIPARIEGGRLLVEAGARATGSPPVLPRVEPALHLESEAVELSGGRMVVHLADRSLSFPAQGLALRSLRLSSALDLGDRLLLGTRGGDLLELRCGATPGACTARRIETGLPEHPVSGLARLDEDRGSEGRVLVAILGGGLFELSGGVLRPSRLSVGSRFVTGLGRVPGGELLVGTAGNGLWRIIQEGGAAPRVVKTRFPRPHVAGIRVPGDLLAARPGTDPLATDVEIDSGYGRYLRLSADRFSREGPGLNARDLGADDLVDLVELDGTVFVAGFDSGLWRREADGELRPVALDLGPDEGRINALALHQGRLWLGTEGGLLALDPAAPEASLVRVLDGAVHDLAPGPSLAVAGAGGLFLVDGLRARRVDVAGPELRPATGTGRYLSVAWRGDELWAGSLDGLLRLRPEGGGFRLEAVTAADGFAAGWVTALESDGERLWVGTYSEGLWQVDERGIHPLPALAGQWVPQGALRHLGDQLWTGGIGMAPARLDLESGQAVALAIPVRDVHAILGRPDGSVLLATSEGLVELPAPELAAR